jgi:hypothetical protein
MMETTLEMLIATILLTTTTHMCIIALSVTFQLYALVLVILVCLVMASGNTVLTKGMKN